MKCSTNECGSEAVAITKIGNKPKCIVCAIKITKEFGVGRLETITSVMPWDQPADAHCKYCGNSITKYLLALGNECPKCRRDL